MSHDHHFEVFVQVDADNGSPGEIFISNTEMDDHVFDDESKQWLTLNEQSPLWAHDETAAERLAATLALPQQIIDAFRLNTDPDGWDIQIMSDIMGLLLKGGWVKSEDWIADGEYPDDEENE